MFFKRKYYKCVIPSLYFRKVESNLTEKMFAKHKSLLSTTIKAELDLAREQSIAVLANYGAYERGQLSGERVLEEINALLVSMEGVQQSLKNENPVEFDQYQKLDGLIKQWRKNRDKVLARVG